MEKRNYVPPEAEMILLSPCEAVAAWDWNFSNVWKNPGYFNAAQTGTASAIVVAGTFAPAGDTDWNGDGFVIKHNTQ